MCLETQQSFLLFQLLLRHAATTRPFPERQLNGLMAVLVATAEGNGLLTGVLAAPALTLVMQVRHSCPSPPLPSYCPHCLTFSSTAFDTQADTKYQNDCQ